MATILILTSPAKGHLYPILETAEVLQRRGHRIIVSTLQSQLPLVDSLGLSGTALPESLDSAELEDWNAKTAVGSLAAVVRQLLTRVEPEFIHAQSLIDEHSPDIVLCDLTSIGSQFAAERCDLARAVWSPTFLPLFTTDGPPMGMGLNIKRSIARDAVLGRTVRALWDHLAKKSLNGFRDVHGLSPLRHADEFLTLPPLIINFTGEPLERQRRDWPASVHMVGPSTWAPPAPLHPEIAAIGEPIALITCSTEFQDDGVLAQLALDALAGTGLHPVVTTGALHPAGLRRSGSSTVLQFGPHAQILDKAAVVISHGGMGITQKALAKGVPMVVVPFGRDQHDVAQRVVEAGAGTSLAPGKLTSEALLRKVGTSLARADNARKVGDMLNAEGSAERAADLVETLG